MNFQTFRTWSWFLHFGSVHSQAARGVCWSPSMLTHATLPCRSRLGLSRPTSCAQVQQQQHAAAATRCMQPSRRVAAACSPLEQEGPAEPQQQQQPQQPQEQQQAETIASAMHRSLSEVAKTTGRQNGSVNLFLVGESEETWRRLDKRVNKYPIQRAFTAIGSGGSEFKASMIKAVEQVTGPVHVECISERPSSKGSYISVTVGPVWVESCEQVIQIYSNMKTMGSGNIKWII